MAKNEANTNSWFKRQLVIPIWAVVIALIMLPVLALFVMAATSDDENIVLSRNDVTTDASGAQIWHGTLMNRTDSPYREIAVTIRFLNQDGQSVGETKGSIDQLEPGEKLNLQASLPSQAKNIQIYSLQWRTGRNNVGRLLGPWAPWSFGYLQYDPSN